MKKSGVIKMVLLFLGLTLGVGILGVASGAQGKDFNFPEVSGWKQSGQTQVFSPDTLYEPINGAADLYLKYDFQELKIAEYRNEKKASVTLEVYRHRTPYHAFGIYSQERLANADFLEIGAQGYYESGVLNFITGVYYVKINGYNTGADDQGILSTFAQKLAANLGGKSSLPAILSSFPPEGKKKDSEKFIARDFLGYSFFHSGFTANYEVAGKKFQIFVMEGANQKDCQDMIQKYLSQTGNPEKKAAEGPYQLKDPYHGGVDLFWKGRYIWGIMSLDSPDLQSKYRKLLEDKIK